MFGELYVKYNAKFQRGNLQEFFSNIPWDWFGHTEENCLAKTVLHQKTKEFKNSIKQITKLLKISISNFI